VAAPLRNVWQVWSGISIPMDLADSSLIVIAELTNITDIITIDSDYYIYKTKNKRSLNNILSPFLKV